MVSHPLQPQRRPADGGFGRTSKEERTVLIITRKAGQKIMLGDGSARPGIEAPRSVPVYREEIWEAVRRDGGAVAVPSPDELPSRPSA
jgi:carbon storage regulator